MKEHARRISADDLFRPESKPMDEKTACALGGASSAQLVWNTTFKLDNGRFLKWVSRDGDALLSRELEKSNWLAQYVPCPRFTTSGQYKEVIWTISEAIPGRNAVDAAKIVGPERIVEELAKGLRILHDRALSASCPFTLNVKERVAQALDVLASGKLDRSLMDSVAKSLNDQQIKCLLEQVPGGEPDLVVCHGDACCPNFIIGSDGKFAGLVDLAELGIADRWFDIGALLWSIEHNFGPGYEDLFFKEYGVERDERKLLFYRVLWQIESTQ